MYKKLNFHFTNYMKMVKMQKCRILACRHWRIRKANGEAKSTTTVTRSHADTGIPISDQVTFLKLIIIDKLQNIWNNEHGSNIKTDKAQNWKLELL